MIKPHCHVAHILKWILFLTVCWHRLYWRTICVGCVRFVFSVTVWSSLFGRLQGWSVSAGVSVTLSYTVTQWFCEPYLGKFVPEMCIGLQRNSFSPLKGSLISFISPLLIISHVLYSVLLFGGIFLHHKSKHWLIHLCVSVTWILVKSLICWQVPSNFVVSPLPCSAYLSG